MSFPTNLFLFAQTLVHQVAWSWGLPHARYTHGAMALARTRMSQPVGLTRTARTPRGRARGSMVLEVLVATATSAVALLGVYGIMMTALRSYGATEGLLEAQQAARFVIERISEEARWAEGVVPDFRCRPDLLCPDRVTLRIPPWNPLRPGVDYQVEWWFDAAAQMIIRRQGRQAEPLGSGFVGMAVRYFAADGTPADRPEDVTRIRLSVTAGRAAVGQARRTLEIDILLRNRLEAPADGGQTFPAPAPPDAPVWRPTPRSLDQFGSGRPSSRASPEGPPASLTPGHPR